MYFLLFVVVGNPSIWIEQGVSGTSSLALGPRERKCNETSIRPKTRIPVDVSDVQYKAEK